MALSRPGSTPPGLQLQAQVPSMSILRCMVRGRSLSDQQRRWAKVWSTGEDEGDLVCHDILRMIGRLQANLYIELAEEIGSLGGRWGSIFSWSRALLFVESSGFR